MCFGSVVWETNHVDPIPFVMSTQNLDAATLEDILSKHTEKILLKLSSVENKLQTQIEQVNVRCSTIEKTQTENDKRIAELEKSAEFDAKTIIEQNKQIETLKKEQKAQNTEINGMKTALDNLKNECMQEYWEQNSRDQYFRTSFFVKVNGIAIQEGEEKASKTEATNLKTLEVVSRLADHCEFQGFDPSQVDVCHRVSKDVFSPIVIKFKHKNDRFRFYKQRSKLSNLHTDDLGFSLTHDQAAILLSPQSVRGVSNSRGKGHHPSRSKSRGGAHLARSYVKDGQIELPFVAIYESLTTKNTELLRLARIAAKAAGGIPVHGILGEWRSTSKTV